MHQQKRYKELEGKRILIADDVEMNQYLVRQLVESWGCIVDIAGDGMTTVEKAANNDFDLVLMDIQMPVIDGVEAARHIRSLPDKRRSSIPIVALTANASKEDHQAYLNAGMNDCLRKPFEEPALFEIVFKHIYKSPDDNMNTISSQTHADFPAAERQIKSYDLSAMESLSGGDNSFIPRMMKLFLDTAPVVLQQIRATADNKQWLELSKAAHKLKATIDSMGIKALKQDIRTLESKAKAGEDPELLVDLAGKTIRVMDEVMAEVKSDYSL
ncbi:MAG TPA: response regulator [Flavitalea sp.]|nr:response regulator [Flavitalea sp.]